MTDKFGHLVNKPKHLSIDVDEGQLATGNERTTSRLERDQLSYLVSDSTFHIRSIRSDLLKGVRVLFNYRREARSCTQL